MAQVNLDAIRKVYPNGFEAVTPSSFNIPDGEFAVLVGPSGYGKSTLLRMIAGLEDITEGILQIGDREVNHIDPADRDIAACTAGSSNRAATVLPSDTMDMTARKSRRLNGHQPNRKNFPANA